jgi:hypothetical protein
MPAVGTTHHVKLGNEYLIVRPNSYTKRAAPTFGARIATGDPDYNNLSIWQHWVQKCWIGGMGAESWTDDAMFDEATGLDTTSHEKATLGRNLKRGSGANWTLGGSTDIAFHRLFVYANVLYALVANATTVARLYSYTVSTQAWAAVTLPASFIVRSWGTFDGKLYLGGSISGTPKLYYATSPGTWTLVTNPAGVTQAIYAMRQYNGKFYVAYGTQVWRFKTDLTWDGSTVFYSVAANSGSNYIQAMETHLGFLYMLSQNGHLHRTDGNNTFDIWSWDGQTNGQSLRSYDGKLFVGTYEYTDTADIGYGVLYQFTGSAVTELKRWGKDGKATQMGQMTVYNRKLFYGAGSLLGMGAATGFGIACYDAVEDAHSIFAYQPDTTTYTDASGVGRDWVVDDVIIFQGKMFCTVRGWGVFFTVDTFRDVALGTAQYTTHTNGGTIISSLYDAGTPGLQKLWRKITVYMTMPSANQSFTVSYSTDGGATYTALTTQTGPSTTGQYVFYLNNIRATRFKWKIVMKTTVETQTPILRGVVVAYLPQPEPNWMWTFTIPVADKWELLDDTVETKNTNTLIAYLEGLYRSQTEVTFIDLDGVTWASNGPGVIIYDMSTVHYDIEQPREADLRITLLETVETY